MSGRGCEIPLEPGIRSLMVLNVSDQGLPESLSDLGESLEEMFPWQTQVGLTTFEWTWSRQTEGVYGDGDVDGFDCADV